MISRSEWIMPAECVRWNAALCYELGLEQDFWVIAERDRHRLKLRIRYIWGREQIMPAFKMKAGSTVQTYYERGEVLIKYCPELERCFTKLEGDQAVEFMMDYWGELFAELFEIPIGVSAE